MGTHGFCLTWKTERKAVLDVVVVIVFFLGLCQLVAVECFLFTIRKSFTACRCCDVLSPPPSASLLLLLPLSLENVTVLQLAVSISLPLYALSL